MRQVILNLAVSLDGFIEGPNGEFDWCFTDQDYGMTGFMERIDSILFGRKSYEVMMQFDANPYPDKLKYVFSRTMPLPAPGSTEVSRGEVVEEVRRIKAAPGGDIWLFGGAQLITALLNAGLVDEMQLSVHPLLLGEGKPLFQDIRGRIGCELIDTKTYSSGLVQLFYRVKNEGV